MRRSLPLILATGALIFSACGGSSDGATTTAPATETTAGGAGASTTTPGDLTTTAPPTTIDAALCYSPGDPGNDDLTAPPVAIRPCELPTELIVTTISTGTGPAAQDGDTLAIDYVGVRSINGEQFDASYLRGVPFDFVLGRGGVIAGWDQGLIGAQAGARIRLDIPAELGYGETPREGGVIQPGDDLTFLLDVRVVSPVTTAEDAPLDLEVESSVGATETTFIDVEIGDGAEVQAGQTAWIHAMLVRGDNRVVMFESWPGGEPLQIPVIPNGASLPGLIEGLQGARVGGTRIITMPPDQAFGPAGEPSLGLPADTDLIAVVEIVGVVGTPLADSPTTTTG